MSFLLSRVVKMQHAFEMHFAVIELCVKDGSTPVYAYSLLAYVGGSLLPAKLAKHQFCSWSFLDGKIMYF